MEQNDEQALKDLHLRFVGRILAGFTHEIKNYLAVIKESAGLIGDMVKIGKMSQSDIPSYLDIVHSIEDQIEKATDQFTYLNRFSHRMDTRISTFRLDECLEELISLMRRFVRQKNASLEIDFSEDIPPLQNNPSMLQLLIFSVLDEKIAGLEKNGNIILQARLQDNSIVIKILSQGASVTSSPGEDTTLSEIRNDIAGQLKGNISTKEDVAITLPIAAS